MTRLSNSFKIKFSSIITICLLIICIVSNIGFAQAQSFLTDTVFQVVDEMPLYEKGDLALRQFIFENYIFPTSAIDQGVKGKIYARFVVRKTGEITDISILRGLDSLLNKELVRVLSLMPKWKPGLLNGKPASVVFIYPVQFDLGKQSANLNKENNEILLKADTMPVFPGGLDSLTFYLESKTKVKDFPKQKISENQIVIVFSVNKDGSVSNISSINKVNPSLEEIAMKAIKEMPSWKPGSIKSKPANVWQKISFEIAQNTSKDNDQSLFYFNNISEGKYFNNKKYIRRIIRRNGRYPLEAEQKNINGIANIGFHVELNGSLSDISFQNQIDPMLANEALRIIKLLPNWNPSIKKNQYVYELVQIRFNPSLTHKIDLVGPPFDYEIVGFKDLNKKESIENVIKEESELQDDLLEPVLEITQVMPEFPGGVDALRSFLNENTTYPLEAIKSGITGTVFVRFVINSKGKVVYASIAKGVHPLFDQEAMRAVKSLPIWQPSKDGKGNPVAVWYTVPIHFEI